MVCPVRHKVDFVLMRYVGYNSRIRRNAVSRKVDRLSVYRPAVENNVSRRSRLGYGKQRIFVDDLNVVNAAVKLKRGYNLFAAFEALQILFIVTDGLLEFRNLDIQRIDR